MSRKDKSKTNDNIEKGFTLMEALWSLMLVLSLMSVIVLKIVEFKSEQSEQLLRDYLEIETIKITQIFYNPKVNFMDDIYKFFEVQDSNIIIKYRQRTVNISLEYKEEVKSGVILYSLILNYPDEIVKLSSYLFDTRKLYRWEYV